MSPSGNWLVRAILAFVLFAVTGVVALGVNPFADQTVTPFDVLATQHAWANGQPNVNARYMERSDVLDSLLPAWTSAKEAIYNGHFPVWNPDVAGGSDLTVPTTAVFTPAFVIFAAVPDSALGIYLAILFELAIAGLGMYLFLRRRLCVLAALVGAVTFQFCGFHAAWLYWQHVMVSIWAPWLLLSIDWCATRPSFRRALAIAAASALIVLGGFPFVSMLMLEMGGAYAVILWYEQWRQSRSTGWRFAYWYACGSVIGLLVCAIPLLTLYSWLQQFDLSYRHGSSIFSLRDLTLLLPPWAYDVKRVEYTMYVGVVMTTLAALSVIVGVVRWKKLSPMGVFGLVLLSASIGVVFSVFPHWIVSRLPGMAYNPWSRAIVIVDVALIVLGAWMVHRLWLVSTGMRRGHILRASVLVLVILQLIEMPYFFHRYNGAVPDDLYYPSIPSVRYMQNHVGPFDYVIADRSFLVSGTLGAYGLREWFAHGFKTPALRQALAAFSRDPFTTPTASRLDGTAIRVNDPSMATFNIRYLAVDSRVDLSAHTPAVPHGATRVALPPLPMNDWIQRFDVNSEEVLRGVSVRLATYRRTDLRGVVVLKILDQNLQIVARSEVSAAGIEDNLMQRFEFAQPVTLAPGKYGVVVEYTSTDSSMRLTAWSLKTPKIQHALYVNGKARDGTLDYKLQLVTGKSPFQRVLTSAGISVYENTASPDGPYFLGDLSQRPTASSGDRVNVQRYRAGAFVLKYDGAEPGFVVVPMNWEARWDVRVGGKRIKPDLKLGVLPAVPVAGPTIISFQFRPLILRWKVEVAWFVLLTSLLLAVNVVGIRWHKETE